MQCVDRWTGWLQIVKRSMPYRPPVVTRPRGPAEPQTETSGNQAASDLLFDDSHLSWTYPRADASRTQAWRGPNTGASSWTGSQSPLGRSQVWAAGAPVWHQDYVRRRNCLRDNTCRSERQPSRCHHRCGTNPLQSSWKRLNIPPKGLCIQPVDTRKFLPVRGAAKDIDTPCDGDSGTTLALECIWSQERGPHASFQVEPCGLRRDNCIRQLVAPMHAGTPEDEESRIHGNRGTTMTRKGQWRQRVPRFGRGQKTLNCCREFRIRNTTADDKQPASEGGCCAIGAGRRHVRHGLPALDRCVEAVCVGKKLARTCPSKSIERTSRRGHCESRALAARSLRESSPCSAHRLPPLKKPSAVGTVWFSCAQHIKIAPSRADAQIAWHGLGWEFLPLTGSRTKKYDFRLLSVQVPHA